MNRKIINSSNKNRDPRERERERIVIWALYDDAQSSYKKATKKYFDNLDLEVHSFGINDVSFPEKDKYFYHKVDLSLNNLDLIKQLKAFPKPTIILASPPCESWSGADCDGKMLRSISSDGYWEVKNSVYYDQYNNKAHPVKKRFFVNKERGRIIGESTIGATIHIIKEFNPKAWIIENPLTSKTWDFQEYHWNFQGIKNKTYYSSYDSSFSLKPTIFKSNIKLNLKNEKIKGNKNHMAIGSYSTRSSIPSELIKDLLEQIMVKINA